MATKTKTKLDKIEAADDARLEAAKMAALQRACLEDADAREPNNALGQLQRAVAAIPLLPESEGVLVAASGSFVLVFGAEPAGFALRDRDPDLGPPQHGTPILLAPLPNVLDPHAKQAQADNDVLARLALLRLKWIVVCRGATEARAIVDHEAGCSDANMRLRFDDAAIAKGINYWFTAKPMEVAKALAGAAKAKAKGARKAAKKPKQRTRAAPKRKVRK